MSTHPTCDFCARPAEFACAGTEMGFARRRATELRVGDLIRARVAKMDTEAKVTGIESFGSHHLDIAVLVAGLLGQKKLRPASFRWPVNRDLWVYGPTPCSKRFCECCGCERGEGVHRCRLHWGIELETKIA